MTRMLQFILTLFWLPVLNAQYGGGQSSSTTTTAPSSTSQSSSQAVQTVDVGKGGFTYNPDTLTVSPGDKVEFHFFPGDHSVTQASFANPCHPASDTSIFSGFVDQLDMVFTLTINDTNPIWLYCAQVGHCQAGMVAVINPPAGGQDTLASFKAAAAGVSGSSEPGSAQGGILGAANSASSSTSSGSASSSSTSSSSSISSSPTTSNPSTSTLSTSTSSTSNPSSTSTGRPSSSEAKALRASDVRMIWIFPAIQAMFMFMA